MPTLKSNNIDIGAVYGFSNMMLHLLKKIKCTHFVIAMDSGTVTFRDKLYAQYKAHRKESPPELKSQFPILHELIDAMGVKKSSHESYEADDIIATYAKSYAKIGPSIIASSDKDLMQLINDNNISMYDSMKKMIYKEKNVKDKFGVDARNIVDYLSLVGDTADNIPGAKSIGPKTAVSLINEYGSIDDIYRNIDQIKNERIKGMLINSKNDVMLSYQLASLRDDVENLHHIEDLVFDKLSSENIREFGKKYGLHSLINYN